MLKSLNIDNFAIISNLHIDWSNGLNIVTGQTGAGKSIILGALSLLSGRKSDTSILLDKEKNLIVEGTFEIKGYALEEFLKDNDIDYSDEIVLRRQISPSGKSRFFIEDTPVSAAIISEISSKLIDIHSQNQSLLFSKEEFQIGILDSISSSRQLREKCSNLYSEYTSSLSEANKLRKEVQDTVREADLLAFQTEEIDNLKLSENEVSSLEDRLSVIEHSEDIARVLSEVYNLLDGDENNICSSISSLVKSLNSSGKYMDKLSVISERLESSSIELKDIAAESYDILSSLSFDEDEKERVEKRLDSINSIMAKHNVSTEKELLEINLKIKDRLLSIEDKQDRLSSLDKKNKELMASLIDACKTLSLKRKGSLSSIEKYVENVISKLGIEKGSFKIQIEEKEPSASGIDKVTFLFSANELSPLQPLSKVASGGELSRIMLALKSLAARNLKLPTIIFDEIDTGVSGSIADAMGDMMENMSKNIQVINITHLPQVAAKGDNQFEVYKENSATKIIKLSPEQRIHKIAEMLSGANVTEAAVEQAKLLLGV